MFTVFIVLIILVAFDVLQCSECVIFLNGKRKVGRESEPPSITSKNPKIFKKNFNLSKNLHDIY